MDSTKLFPMTVFLTTIIIFAYIGNKGDSESMAASLPDVITSSNETNTVPVEVRTVTTSKNGSLIQATGMSETEAKEFAKDNDIPFDNNNQPVSHEGDMYMLFPDLLNPGDSVWSADNYANKKN